ncbi:MAG: hypothetical protein ABFR90_05165 [Planctomycetota bacterium]
MLPCFVYIVAVIAALFWLVQVIDLLYRPQDYFESHVHKLVWFIALCVGNIIAAIWYFVWIGNTIKAFNEK